MSIDVEEADNSANDDVTAGDKDDTIYFPGDENDDVNTNFLIEQLGFKDFNIGKHFIVSKTLVK